MPESGKVANESTKLNKCEEKRIYQFYPKTKWRINNANIWSELVWPIEVLFYKSISSLIIQSMISLDKR